jgi:Spy/CpxP family protein refolding chaperone
MKASILVLAAAFAATTASAQGNPPPRPAPQQQRNGQQAPPPDPFAACLFAPEEVMSHQSEIGLKDDQRAKLAAEMGRAQAKATEVQWLISSEQEKLQQLVRSATVDEAAVLKQMDRILSLEQDVKRAQMTLMVRVKNTLTVQQQEQLRLWRPVQPRISWTLPADSARLRAYGGSGC